MECYKCDDCSAQPEDDKIQNCTVAIALDAKEKCYTKPSKDDKTKITRGCFYDLSVEDQSECSKNTEDCKTCETGKCNKEVTVVIPEVTTESTKEPSTESTKVQGTEPTLAPVTEPTKEPPTEPTKEPSRDDFQCIVCRSDKLDQKACEWEIKNNEFVKKCEITPAIDEDKACYVDRLRKFKKLWSTECKDFFLPANNVVIRDCITTAKALNYPISEEKCGEESKCNYCKTQNCNTVKPRNSGAGLNVFGTLIAFAAVIVTKYL